MATVTLRDVRKSFGRTEVIHGVDIEVADGEFIVIVGPSGCGKSTVLRMVAGLESVSSGEILIDGRRVNDKEPMERDIAMVFQNYALYPHMTVFDNMAYGLKIARRPKAEIAERVAEAARLLKLEPYLDRRPRQLSGGQRQRVAMGRAIVRKPVAFLFDEPLSNLDAKLRGQTRLEIKALQRRIATTSIYVTHDQLEAMTLADRLVVMNDGRIEQIGSPIEVYERPASVFVAGFIGAPPMNFLALEPGSDQARMVADVLGAASAPGEALGFRPEDATLGDGAEPFDRSLRLSLTALLAEQIGSDTYLHASLGREDDADPTAIGESLIVRLPGRETIAPGTPIVATVPIERVHRFGSDGRRLEPPA